MRIKFFLLLLLIYITGCDSKQRPASEKDTTKISEETYPMNLATFKGMYSKTGNTIKFTECGSGKQYIVSPDGDIRIIETVFKTHDSQNPERKLYVSAEGFSSVRQKQTGEGFDTVLVITKLIGTDTDFNCDKQ